MINSLKNLTLGQLKKAVEIKERIESLERELNELVGAPTPARTAPSPVRAANGQPRGKARWSAAKKAKMAAIKRAWWAKQRRISGVAPSIRKPRRQLSAAAHANISRAAKERWARRKAAERAMAR